MRYVKSKPQAEDLLQDSFIKIYKDLHQFDENKGSFNNWSKRITINICLQYLRKNNVLKDFENIVDISHQLKIEPTAIEDLNLKDLTLLILKLPKGYRTIFNMYVIDGYTHKEIAEELNININTSKTQLMKARKALKIGINEQNQESKKNYV